MLAVVLLPAGPERLTAQDSHLTITGLGVPEKWESVRARSAGGAFALFDPLSPTADAGVALLGRLSASAATMTSHRSLEVSGQSASLRGTRFPYVVIGGPISSRLFLAGGFNTYLNRSFQATTPDTIDLRGQLVPVEDEVTSDGGIADVRVALAWRPFSRLRIGAAAHLLSGSTSVRVLRRFGDSTAYLLVGERDEPRFHGYGASGGLMLDITSRMQLSGYVRSDAVLEYTTRDAEGSYDLPITWGAAARWIPIRRVAIAAAVQSSTWGVAGTTVNAHDTFSWSVGMELGEATSPLRLGVRRGQLPFGPGPDAPTELAYTAGLGLRFSADRALIDVGVERVRREGQDLEENIWNVMVGITVRP
jgi:hypothetical protein